MLAWVRGDVPPGVRPLESHVMDWADDVAYSVHDVEDGLHGGLVDLALLDDDAEVEALLALCRERYAPEIAFLLIGDRYTMGPSDAALAAEWVGVKTVVPMHYGTFPELTGTPSQLREHCTPRGIDVLELRPGETVG